MASIIPYTSDVFTKLKNSTPRPQSQMYNSNIPNYNSEFYESLSNEIDLQLHQSIGSLGNMILEDDHSEKKIEVNNIISNTLNKYSRFIKEDFINYYSTHHSIGFYEQILGRGYVVNCISNYFYS